jgi:hypothetical protein
LRSREESFILTEELNNIKIFYAIIEKNEDSSLIIEPESCVKTIIRFSTSRFSLWHIQMHLYIRD